MTIYFVLFTSYYCRKLSPWMAILCLLKQKSPEEQHSRKNFHCHFWSPPLRVGDKGANVPKPHDEEGHCLHIKEKVEVVFPKENIVAANKE